MKNGGIYALTAIKSSRNYFHTPGTEATSSLGSGEHALDLLKVAVRIDYGVPSPSSSNARGHGGFFALRQSFPCSNYVSNVSRSKLGCHGIYAMYVFGSRPLLVLT